MLANKMEMRAPPGSRPRDGRHCDLCGCSQPAVRCDKCGCQIFCLSCDDMYHRHPKRRFHLRKAVDPTPPVPQARPVLPVKVSQLATSNPGDPSKMPLPPPRKKKSLFGSFRKPNSSENSPPLPKKEYTWSDRLGSIKKFMSNRPLPPLPNADDTDSDHQPTTNGQSVRGDLSFIHRRSEERPPQLPQRSPKSPDFPGANQENGNRFPGSPMNMPGQIRNGSQEPNAMNINQNREFPNNEENQWNNMMNNQNESQKFSTLNRPQRGFMPPGAPGYPGGMHLSSSATDLQNLQNTDGMQAPPHFPHYPMNPHMPPHYPYPMYPQYPNYPQYFGNSFANLSHPATSEGDFSDHSETASRHSSKRQPFRKRAKRSQSVLMDRMAYPGQFYPFGPYPGYGPWGAPMPMEAPPSPASSVRSLNRSGRTRRRKKTTSEEDDDEAFSMSSSPLSRPKSSSSDFKDAPRAPLATQTSSSEDESDGERNNRRNKANTIQKRQTEPLKPPSPALEPKRVAKLRKSSSKQTDSDASEAPETTTYERKGSRDSSSDKPALQQSSFSSGTSDSWECKHCTFVNPAGNKICQVCCKTATPRTETPVSPPSRPPSAAAAAAVANGRKQSVGSDKGRSSPEKRPEVEEESGKKERQDMASLNSALDEAEKQISKGLEELMKLKDDIDANMSKDKSKTADTGQSNTESGSEDSKPVYKSSGRMRTSILDKLNLNKPQTSNASVSTSTETGPGNNRQDKILEARRHSNSSTTSETYNSPMAQSPELERAFLGNRQKRDSSCQTQQQDSLVEYLAKKREAEEAFLGRPVNNFGFGYGGDRMDMVTSPVPSMYDRYFGGGFGMMQRSHSRASLFTGRVNDFGPMDYGGGFGYGPTPMYRSVSRGSLTGDYPDGRMSEFSNLRKPDFYLSMEELVERRRQENIRAQGLELVRMIREAEQQGFNADDIQVALSHCGKQNPLEWLQENWRNMVDSVLTLSTNYGNDKKENDIGQLSESEARDALRLHKGNIWAAVTECVEGRQRKYLELSARGNFQRKEIVDALTSSEGDVEMAYAKLSKSTGKPFLMRIWGAGEGVQNQDGARPLPEELNDFRNRTLKDETLNSDELSEEIWSDDGEWDEDEDEYEGRGDIEDLQTCREDLTAGPQEMRTPESDKSDYCDAFPIDDRNASSPSDDIFFVIPEAKREKKKGFLSKLVALRRDSKENEGAASNIGRDEIENEQNIISKEDAVSQNSTSSSEQPKNGGALSALKNTLSVIKDTVTGGTKNDKKLPCAQPEKRTIIVKGQLEYNSLSDNRNDNVTLTSIKAVDIDNTQTLVSKDSSEMSKQEENNTTKDSIAKKTVEDDIKQNEDKLKKDDSRDSNLIKSGMENSSKLAESKKPAEGTKKPLSLAERLKFTKQYRSSTNISQPSTSHVESSPPGGIINNISESKLPREIVSTKSDKITKECTADGNKYKLENEVLSHVHPIKDRDKQSESKILDATQVDTHNKEKAKEGRKYADLPNDISDDEMPVYDIVKPNPQPVLFQTNVTNGYKEDKSENKQKNKDSLQKKDEIKPQINIPDKKSVPSEIFSHKEISSEIQADISSTNTAKCIGEDKVLEQSENLEAVDVVTSDASKNISDAPVDKYNNETKKTGKVDTSKESVKQPKTSSSSNTDEIEIDLKTTKESIANVVSKAEASKSEEKIHQIISKDAKIENEVPNSTIMPLSTESANSVFSASPAESLESKSDKSNSKKESKGSQEIKELANDNLNETRNIEITNLSVVKSDEISQCNSSNNIADNSEKISLEKTENLDNPILTETDKLNEFKNIAKVRDTQKSDSTLGQESTLKSDETSVFSNAGEVKEKLPKSDETAFGNKVVELKENLPTTNFVENISEKSNEPKDGIVYDKNESTTIPSEQMNIPENASDNKISCELDTKQNNGDLKPKEIILDKKSNDEKDSTQKNEAGTILEDSKSFQNTDVSSETVQKPSVSEQGQIKKAGVPSKFAASSSSSAVNEDPKTGKFVFSKSGKVKKTQPKEEKKLPSSQTENKIVTKPLISIPSSSHKLSTVVEMGDEKSNSEEVAASLEVPAPLSVASGLVENKLPTEKEPSVSSNDGRENSGTEIIEAKASDIPSENNSIVPDKDKSISLDSESKTLAQSGVSGTSENNNVEGLIKDQSVVLDTTHDLKATAGSKVASEKSKTEEDSKMPDTKQNLSGETPSTSTKDSAQNLKAASTSKDDSENLKASTTEQKASGSDAAPSTSSNDVKKTISQGVELQAPVISKEYPGKKNSSLSQSTSNTNIPESSNALGTQPSKDQTTVTSDANIVSDLTPAQTLTEEHSNVQNEKTSLADDKNTSSTSTSRKASLVRTDSEDHSASQAADSEDTDIEYSDESRPSSVTPPSPVDALRSRFEGLAAGGSIRGSVRPQSPFRRMSFNSRKQVIALERKKDVLDKPWMKQVVTEPVKTKLPKRSIKQQLEMERKVRKMVADRKCRTYRKAEIVVQLMDMNFEEEEAIDAAHECSTLEQAISYLQQECLLCAGHFPVSQIVSMTHCQHRACRECIRAYFTVQIRDRTILDLLCPFCNEPDIGDEDVAQDYFNHLDIMLKKLVDLEIHELFQRKLRDRVLMKDPNFRWCSQCSSGFIAMPNLKRLVCPDCNAVTCASCRRLWEREHQGISCEAFAALKDASDPETQAAGLAKMLTEDGIACPSCHFRYALAKGGCMHFRCIQCQHDFCSGCSRPFKMGQKCGVSEFCAKLGLHAHHPRNCLFYLRDKEPEDLQKLLDMNDIKYDKESSDETESDATCQVMEQKETADGMVDDHCGKDVQEGYAGLCRIHYVEYLGQLVKKYRVDPIQIFDNDDLELVLRRANVRLPPKRYRENDAQYREKLVKVIQEELPLDKMDGS